MDFQLTPEQAALRDRVREVAEREFRPRAAHWDETEEYPHENVKRLVELGLMGMTIPRQYGGGGRPLLDPLLAVEEGARACGVTGRIIVDSNFGPTSAIIHYGTEAQKRKFLPMIVQGDKPAVAITEPEAGSAATDLKTSARLVGDHYVVNGRKRWITGGGVSHIYVVFVRLTDQPGAAGIGGLIVELGTPGFRIGKREKAMGLRGIPETELIFEDCRVPRENLLVGPGDGFKQLMMAYNAQRLGAAAVALGIAQGAFDLALEYAGQREQFGRPIGSFQGLQWMLADMAIRLKAARLLIWEPAAAAGHALPAPYDTAIAKTYAGEVAIEVTNAALQIFGANGYSREFPLERMLRDARMFTIGGGTAQVQRNVIASHLLGRPVARRGDR
jgi:alkylation response protein AidB-like acyl-CoA dehydrogenase